jgi:hypothetical protein
VICSSIEGAEREPRQLHLLGEQAAAAVLLLKPQGAFTVQDTWREASGDVVVIIIIIWILGLLMGVAEQNRSSRFSGSLEWRLQNGESFRAPGRGLERRSSGIIKHSSVWDWDCGRGVGGRGENCIVISFRCNFCYIYTVLHAHVQLHRAISVESYCCASAFLLLAAAVVEVAPFLDRSHTNTSRSCPKRKRKETKSFSWPINLALHWRRPLLLGHAAAGPCAIWVRFP